MNKNLFVELFAVCSLCISCTDNVHFITDTTYRETVERAYTTKKAYFADTALFSIFERDMTLREREALMFLYAYMPAGDITDYPGELYLNSVRASFAAKSEMPWGKLIPEDIFRHFVLPDRVNNESIDGNRQVFFAELKNRVSNLSMYDAVLEVNHWCHEKVVYMPTDARTCSPLATVKTAYGRCGEESVFTVAALRAAGIPARQVYTPRWAHTDDNHAWVEAWVDGKWYFLGACEPEPVLNLAWFNAPASRSMLMHTKVFGFYKSSEETVEQTDCYTEINVTGNYAPVEKLTVTVTDAIGQPAENASVEFKIYNYAEFFTVADLKTDADGNCSLTAGKGDMLVWATKDGMFGYAKSSSGNDHLTVVMDKKPGDKIDDSIDIIPPAESNIAVEVTAAQRNNNTKRLAEEDSVRMAYIGTFYSEKQATELAEQLGTNKSRTIEVMLKSRGNYPEIEKFLRDVPVDKRSCALDMLVNLPEKDLHDTPASVLSDHLNYSPTVAENSYSHEIYMNYVLNPRIANELLSSYKEFLSVQTNEAIKTQTLENPIFWVDWVKQNIKIHDELNPQLIPISPSGVWKARIADRKSRDIFFIAALRSMGIPARHDPVSDKPQYYRERWLDVDFDNVQQNDIKGFVDVACHPLNTVANPKYYSHFTIAAFQPDGRLRTLNLETSSGADMGAGMTWDELFKKPLQLDAGNYLLVSGTRMASGKVMAHIRSFTVAPDKTASVELVLRNDADDLRVIGNIDAEAKLFYTIDNGDEKTTILNVTGRGYFILGIIGVNHEPTNHAMNDLALLKNEFNSSNIPILLLFGNGQKSQLFDKTDFGELPANTVFGIDSDNDVMNMIAGAAKLPDTKTLPVFIIADTFGRVVFVSQGYTIGLGDQLIKVIGKLDRR